MSDTSGWSLIAHGGAKDIDLESAAANRAGMQRAIIAGGKILDAGGTALDAVEEVVKLLEDDPAFNAGLHGAVKNEADGIELAASIMNGATLDIGAIACVRNIEHPVSLARALLKDKAIFLVGEGAMDFARQQGFAESAPSAAPPSSAKGCDTVGCVARDRHGNLAAATSTAGLTGTRPGRVGDVPMPGCGFYADNKRGAASASGVGEAIARVMLTAEFLHFLPGSTVADSTERAISLLEKVQGDAGLIAIGPDGQIGWAHNSPNFAVAVAREGAAPRVYLKKDEDDGS